MGALPIVAGAGIGMEIYGQIKGASDRADAARQEAQLKNEQADELLSREMINESVMRRQEAQEQLTLGNHFSGFEESNVGTMIAAKNNMEMAISNSQRDAQFKARMLRAGANIDSKLASDLVTSSYWSAGGTALGGGANIYSKYGNFGGKTASLPGAPTLSDPTGSASDMTGRYSTYATIGDY